MIYELIAEDLTHLGGQMGTEYTTEKSLGLFDSPEKAKAAGEKHYKENGGDKEEGWWKGRFAWEKGDEGHGYSTPDLRFVMYHIRPREVK